MAEAHTLHFGRCRIGSPQGPLSVDGVEVKLPPKALAVLGLLASQAGRVVTKAALLDAVWAETMVGEDALAFQVQALRQALGDDARNPRYIETVHRVGYRLIVPVTTTPADSRSRWPVLRSPDQPAPGPQPPPFPVVGRDAELDRLHALCANARRGERQMVFVTGEAGIGKTALVETFLAQGVSGSGPEGRIGRGQCVEQYGAGEAYLPVLEAVGRLARTPEGEDVVEILRRYGPSWLVQLPALVDDEARAALQRTVHGVTRERMLREMAEALEAMAAEQPLVLLLEDLHWSDPSTVALLEMVARRREAARLLVLATYRPVDLIVTPHPLKAVKQELMARGQATEIPLGHLSSQAVQAFVARRLDDRTTGATLGDFVYRRTEGHPLFMVHVTDYLQQARPVHAVPDALATRTQEIEQAVPHALRELIEAQLGRLPVEEQRVLEAASVAGTEFEVASVAAGGQTTAAAVEAICEGLAQKGQFIEDRGLVIWPDGTVGGRYGFRHALYRDVLYGRLGAGQQARLHLAIGGRKATGFGERSGEIAAELAVHFEHGGAMPQAAHYYRQAGEKALRQQAYQEVLAHTEKGLALLQGEPPRTDAAARQELELHITRGAALLATRGFSAPEVESTYTRARTLSQQLEDVPALVPVLYGLWNFSLTRGDLPEARALAQELLALAERHPDPIFRLQACNVAGTTALFMGEPLAAKTLFEQSVALYVMPAHQDLVTVYGEDPGVVSRQCAALADWVLGYPAAARRHLEEGMRLAQALGYPFGVAQMLWAEAVVAQQCGDARGVRDSAQRLIALCLDKDFPTWLVGGRILHGWALAAQGEPEDGIGQIRHGVADWRAMGTQLTQPYSLALLAMACVDGGRAEEGLEALGEALDMAERTGEQWYKAELYRLKGELTLQSSHRQAAPEACFLRAIEIAQRQGAKSLELRAAMSLARLARTPRQRQEARRRLAGIYGWFTEGFDTADLDQARTLLGAS